jgi:hypothetical protein
MFENKTLNIINFLKLVSAETTGKLEIVVRLIHVNLKKVRRNMQEPGQ